MTSGVEALVAAIVAAEDPEQQRVLREALARLLSDDLRPADPPRYSMPWPKRNAR
jgi:hypothetical protein